MMATDNPNAAILRVAIAKLTPLLEQIVFVGGCVTGLLVTDPYATPVRTTLDVDVIVEVASYAEFVVLEEKLRQLGFHEPQVEGSPVCRWITQNLILDFMPVDPSILGFSNRWYRPAMQNAKKIEIDGNEIRVITASYFLASKIEAFHARGEHDYRLSRDLEDIITVLDGRAEIVEETGNADISLRQYLAEEFSALIADRDFLDALPGHLLPDATSQQRINIVMARMQQLIGKL